MKAPFLSPSDRKESFMASREGEGDERDCGHCGGDRGRRGGCGRVPGGGVLRGPLAPAASRGADGMSVLDTVLPGGLTSKQAAARLAADGQNRLPVRRPTPAWRLLAAELVHFFALLFWVAGGLAFLAGMPQLGMAVFVVVVLNGVFAFAQERRAEH